MRKKNSLITLSGLLISLGCVLSVLVSFGSSLGKVQAQGTTSPFSFGVAGDYSNGGTFQSTVTAVKGQNPDFQLAVGDLAYTTAEQSWCNVWKNAGFNNILIESGNHDSGESSSGNINTYAQFCPYTLSSSMTGTYAKQYYFDYPLSNPNSRFIMVTPGLGGSFIGMDTNYAVGHPGYTFVQNAIGDARTKGIKWLVVGTHKNCLSMGTKSCEIGTDLMNLLISNRVDLVLQGHDHNYQRSKQLTCATTNTYNASCVADDGADGFYTKGAGTVFLITGVGGQGQYTINTSDSEAGYFAKWMGSNANLTYGFSKFSVTDSQISAQFIRSAGGTFSDSFTIASGPIPSPSPVVSPIGTPTPTPIPSPTPTPTPTPTPVPTPSPTPIPVVLQPDLVVTDITPTPNSPATGNSTSFSIIIKNQGTGPTVAGTIHGVGIYIDGAVSASTWSDTMTSSIPPGGSVKVDTNGPPWVATQGTHNIVAFVDDSNRIVESNETNNKMAKVLDVPAATVVGPSPTPVPPTPATTLCQTTMPTNTGLAQTSVQVTEGTSYKIWSRVNSGSDSSNSYWLQIDNGCPVNVGDQNGTPANAWYWVDYKEGSNANKIVVPLSVGSHVLKVAGREAGLKIDRLILISDLACLPTELGENCLAPLSTPIPAATSSPVIVAKPTPTASPVASPIPTIVSSSGAYTFKPDADSYVDSNNTSENKGTSNQIRVDGSPIVNSYIRFNVQNLSGSAASATLRIFANSDQSAGFSVKGVSNNNWGETTINYGNAPESSEVAVGSSGPVKGGNWYSVDVTSLVKGNGLVSFALTTSNQTAISLASRESGNNAPQLIVNAGGSSPTVSPLPAITPPPSPAPLPSSIPTTTTTTLTFTPSDDATVKKDSSSRNYGGADSLEVDQESFKDILMKFNVSGVDQKTIVGVRLRLYAEDSSPSGGTFHKVASNDWSEGSVTWDSAPQNDVTPFTTLGKVSEGRWYEVDLSGLVGGDGTYSFKIHSTDDDGADYYSKEKGSEFAPQLIVVVK